MIITTPKQKQIIAILTKGDKELKAEMVVLHTRNPELCSTNDLTFVEANEVIKKLGGKPLFYDNWALFDKHNKQHRTVLSHAINYGWRVANPELGEIADLHKLSEWLKSGKSPVKKPLKRMEKDELSKVISALYNMIKKKYK